MNINKKIGRVKGFGCHKGWGFIEFRGIDEDVFVHYSDIQAPGYKRLEIGDYVLFSLVHGDKGFAAKEVRKLTTDEAFGFLRTRSAPTLLDAIHAQ